MFGIVTWYGLAAVGALMGCDTVANMAHRFALSFGFLGGLRIHGHAER